MLAGRRRGLAALAPISAVVLAVCGCEDFGDPVGTNGGDGGADTTPPSLSAATALSGTQVEARFSERVTAATAAAAANYTVFETATPANTVSVTGATLSIDARTVTLALGADLQDGVDYTVQVKDVQDEVGNTITGNATATFTFFAGIVMRTVALTPVKDNSLYQESGNLSNALGRHLFAGRTVGTPGTGSRRALLAFAVTDSIPPGATIRSVSLTLRVSRVPPSATPQTFGLHRVLQDWGEGSSRASGQEGRGGSAATGDATWTQRFFGSATWTGPGGDFVPGASASVTVGTTLTDFTWSGAGLVADVQAWVDGTAPEFGWILVGNEAAIRTARRFASRENPGATIRPRLVVEFTRPAVERL